MTKRQVFIDTETTGLSAQKGHRIVELAAVEAIGGKVTGRVFHAYIDPERSIDPRAEQVHGLSAAYLKSKPRFIEFASAFVEFVRGAECLMHNATFDAGFINAELSHAGYMVRLQDLGEITCTMKLARSRFPGETSSLDALIKRSGLPVTRTQHSALEDASLLAEVYFRTLKEKEMSSINTNIGAPLNNSTLKNIVSPADLGMEKVIELVGARNETFFYREKHKRIIDHRVINEHRWKKIAGPLVYVVTDSSGTIRYIGKWESETALYSRWLRHKTIHHQERARNLYIAELDAGCGPLAVWSTSIGELKNRLPKEVQNLPEKEIAAALEALWIQRWKKQLSWNNRMEPIPAGFHDGNFWN